MVLSSSLTLILIVAIISWLLALTGFVFVTLKRYKELTLGVNKKDLTAITLDLKNHSKKVDSQIDALFTNYESLIKQIQPFIQKIGYVRFNPFGNTGGDHSFCLVMLDEMDNGILITSLHTRQLTRLYTKELIAGKPSDGGELTKEEVKCINQANQWRKR